MKRLLRALVGVAVITAAAASAHAADDWLNLATVSMTNATTPKLTNRYVCYTDGTDLACNAPSLYVSTGGLVGIGTTNPSATLHIVDSNLNHWRFDSASRNATYFYSNESNPRMSWGPVLINTSLPGYGMSAIGGTFAATGAAVGLPATRTLGFYTSNGSAMKERARIDSVGRVGIGWITPTVALEVSGTISATNFVGDGAGLTGITAASSDRIVSGTTSMVAISDTGYISLTQSGVNTGWFNPQTGFVTIGVSSTGPISGTSGYFNGNVGVRTAAPAFALDVNGTFRAFSGSASADFGGSSLRFAEAASSIYTGGYAARSATQSPTIKPRANRGRGERAGR